MLFWRVPTQKYASWPCFLRSISPLGEMFAFHFAFRQLLLSRDQNRWLFLCKGIIPLFSWKHRKASFTFFTCGIIRSSPLMFFVLRRIFCLTYSPEYVFGGDRVLTPATTITWQIYCNIYYYWRRVFDAQPSLFKLPVAIDENLEYTPRQCMPWTVMLARALQRSIQTLRHTVLAILSFYLLLRRFLLSFLFGKNVFLEPLLSFHCGDIRSCVIVNLMMLWIF